MGTFFPSPIARFGAPLRPTPDEECLSSPSSSFFCLIRATDFARGKKPYKQFAKSIGCENSLLCHALAEA